MSVLHGPTQRGRSYHQQQLHTDETSDGVVVKEVGGQGGFRRGEGGGVTSQLVAVQHRHQKSSFLFSFIFKPDAGCV